MADEINWGGVVPWATPVDLARTNGSTIQTTERTLTSEGLESGSALAPAESILVSSRAPIGYTSRNLVPMAFNQGCKAAIPSAAIDAHFLHFALIASTELMKAAGSGSTFLELSTEAFASLHVPIPKLEEQRRIADFLDDRVARIDQIITARRTQIAAVREHWALELEWVLGSISETTRASRVLRVLPGFAFPSEAYSEDPSDRRLLRGVNVAVGSTRWDEVVYWPEDRVDEVGEFVLGPGDLVLGMDRPWIGDGLRIARVTEDDGSPLLLQRVAKLTSEVLDSEYLFWAYQSCRFRDQVELDLTGLSVPHLSGDQIGSFDIPVCDAHRQAAVLGALNAGTESVSRLINAIGASIGRLDEYKQSLITAAVTGEIDVTAAGGGIPG